MVGSLYSLVGAAVVGVCLTALWQLFVYWGQRASLQDRAGGYVGAVNASRSMLPKEQQNDKVNRREIEQIVAAVEARHSLIAWVQNLVWFLLGSGVSLFSSELRRLFGFP